MRITEERVGEARQATVTRLLRIQKRLDILFNADHLYSVPDVRRTVVLHISPSVIAVTQSSPPILPSKLSEKIEASFVNFDPVKAERSRWGWSSRVVGFDHEYIPPGAAPESQAEAAVFVAAPEDGALVQTNVRFDYRLTVTSHDGIFVKTSPCSMGVRLINFSAGGVQVTAPGLPNLQPGALMHVNMIFPWPDKKARTQVKSLAEVMWMEYVSEHRNTRLGLAFRDMDMETRRTFSKIINHYMLAEQRLRKAMETAT